jgi:hypothetical protein
LLLLVLLAWGYLLLNTMDSLPSPLRLVFWIGGGVIGVYTFFLAVEYFVEKYKQFGPSWITAAHQSWLQSPWKATVMVAVFVGIVCAIGGGIVFYWWASNRPKETNSTHSDLTMSVINYRYDAATDELSAQVQFVNNGKIRRTILGVTFSYRDADVSKNEHHPLVDSASDVWGHGDPLYIEPGQPVVIPYKRKLGKPELTKTPGIAFGLQVTSLSAEGTMNFATIETMVVTTAFDRPALLSGSKRNISLEATVYSPMEDPMVVPAQSPRTTTLASPQVTPPPEAAPKQTVEAGPKDVQPEANKQAVQPTALQQEVSALYKGRTAIKVLALLEPYKGRTIDVVGKIAQVQRSTETVYFVVLQGTPDGGPGCICFFNIEWEAKLGDLEQGSVIKIRGKIAPDQNGQIIVMRECELL